MSHCQITLSVNAGVALHLGAMRRSGPTRSTTVGSWGSPPSPPSAGTFFRPIRTSPSPDLLFFTHCHPDHYSRALTEQVIARNPQVAIWCCRSRSLTASSVLAGPSSHLTLEGSAHGLHAA